MKFFRAEKKIQKVQKETIVQLRRNRVFRGVGRNRGISDKASISPEKRLILKGNFRSKVASSASGCSWWMSAYFLLWGIFISVFVYAIFFSPLLRIDQQELPFTTTVAPSIIEKNINDFLSGYSWRVLPNDSYVVAFFRRKQFDQMLSDRFPSLRSVSTRVIFPKSISVSIEERTLALISCSGGPCFLIDEHGVAYDDSVEMVSSFDIMTPITLVDDSTKLIVYGEVLFSEEFLQFASESRRRLFAEFGVSVSSKAKTSSRISNEIRFVTMDGWELWLSGDIALDKSLRTLHAFFAKMISEEERKNLLYIDMRTESRVFYRVSEDNQNDGEGDVEISEESGVFEKSTPSETKEKAKKDKKKK